MTLTGLDHFSLCLPPEGMATTVAFYCDVLGLSDGHRPPFPFPGHWLYVNGHPIVHLIGLGDGPRPPGSAQVDHIAVAATGLASTRAHLAARGVAFDERYVPLTGLSQLFVTDPNGVVIELVFAEASDTATHVFGERKTAC